MKYREVPMCDVGRETTTKRPILNNEFQKSVLLYRGCQGLMNDPDRSMLACSAHGLLVYDLLYGKAERTLSH